MPNMFQKKQTTAVVLDARVLKLESGDDLAAIIAAQINCLVNSGVPVYVKSDQSGELSDLVAKLKLNITMANRVAPDLLKNETERGLIKPSISIGLIACIVGRAKLHPSQLHFFTDSTTSTSGWAVTVSKVAAATDLMKGLNTLLTKKGLNPIFHAPSQTAASEASTRPDEGTHLLSSGLNRSYGAGSITPSP